MCSPSSAVRSVARFRLPLGRPFGFPDLPRLNCLVFEFDDASNSSSPLCREDRRAAAAEGVEDDAVSSTAIADQVGEEGDRFHGGMELKITATGWMQAVDPRIIKNIGAIAALTAKSKIIDVGRGAVLEHRN